MTAEPATVIPMPAAQTPAARPHLPLTIAAVALASFLLPASISGASVALPAIAHDLHASIGDVQWMQNAFNIPFTALALIAGALADRWGRRRVLRSGIAVFGAGALLIAVSPHILAAVLLRFAQGAGAAAVLAAGAAVLANAAHGKRQRSLAFGMLGTAFGSGLALGPLAGGALASAFGWRALFVALALGAAVAFGFSRFAQESRSASTARLDLAGVLSFAAGLAALTLGFVTATGSGWTHPLTLTAFGAGALLLALFALVEWRRGERAVFDIRLLRSARFVALVLQPFTVSLGFVVFLVYLPAYFQGVGGMSALASGLLLLPMTLPVLLLPFAGSALAARFSVRAVLVAASLLGAAGSLGLTVLSPTPGPGILAPLLLIGAGVGLGFGVMDNAAVGAVPAERAGAASGLFNTLRLLGETTAVAGSIAVLGTITALHLPPGPASAAVAASAVQGSVAPALAGPLSAGLTDAFHLVSLGLAGMCLTGAALTFMALRERESGRTRPRPTEPSA